MAEGELPKRTPAQIIGDDVLTQLIFEGYEVVPARRTLTPYPRTHVIGTAEIEHVDGDALSAPVTVDEGDTWRDLALQFDGHRIEALSMLRFAVRHIDEYATVRDILREPLQALKVFLASPPLSGEAVLAQRLSASPSQPKADGPGEDGWQPIETARKRVDETVLLRIEHVNYAIADAADKHRWEETVTAYWTDFNNGGWVWHGLAGSPTHWQPAPSASIKREA